MSSKALAITSLLAVLAAGCTSPAEERAQWTVVVATDARVPQFGDWLLVEVLSDGPPCSDCRRTIGASAPARWPISFGIIPPANGTARVRAVLFRSSEIEADGLPNDASIEAVAELPVASGPTRVALTLSTKCFGVPSNLDARQTCLPETGALGAEPTLTAIDESAPLPSPGDWQGFEEVRCTQPVAPEQVCVPGGAFLLGGANFELVEELVGKPEHVVQLSPFLMDRDEMTVGEIKKWLPPGGPLPVEQDLDPKAKAAPCRFHANDTTNDAMPVNCISHALARAVCEAQKKRLPTEAEWEYAAGNLELETTYPWGADEDVCSKTVLGRGRTVLELGLTLDPTKVQAQEATTCRVTPNGALLDWGPAAGGSADDVTLLGIHNLGGNVAEWVEDRFARYSDPFWDDHGVVLKNPVCDEIDSGNAAVRPVRGASWRDSGFSALSAVRNASLDELASPGIGFRCVAPE